MGKLGLEMFLEYRKGKKDTVSTTSISHPTGFLPLDYANGHRVKVYDSDDNIIEEYDSIGLVDGTVTMIIADTGLGKTTLAMQIACEIASKFEESFVEHDDIENSSHIDRVPVITGKKPSWVKNHYVMYVGDHGESIADRIIEHCKMKLNNRADFEYNTGLKDMFGNDIITFKPTVIIIDSIAMMRSESSSITEDMKISDGIKGTMGNNMVGARSAKFNSEMFKQINPWLKKSSTMCILISHITGKVDANAFSKSPRDLIGMGENEMIAGGKLVKYATNNVLRLKNKQTLKSDEQYKINGNVVSCAFLKSRTSSTNVEFELIFDKDTGFSKCLTLLNFAINNKIVKQKGIKYVVPGYEEYPFSKGTYIEEARKHPEIVLKLYDLCLPTLQGMMSTSSKSNAKNDDKKLDDLDDGWTLSFF